MIRKALTISLFLILPLVNYAQIQIGSDIEGVFAGDRNGGSVSMPNNSTIAIGANYNDDSGMDAGHVRIFEWNSTDWVQKGNAIEGEATGDESGISVSMGDSVTVAIGAYLNDDSDLNAGHVRIYSWDGISWNQKGNDIDGDNLNDFFGLAINMADANTVAIGARQNDGNGQNSGQVKIYSWNGLSWVQKGSDIYGQFSQDLAGKSVSMPNANTCAIGSPDNDVNGQLSGHVRIFEWNGNNWQQKGISIDGTSGSSRFGSSLSMPDSITVAIGAFTFGVSQGQVKVFKWVNNTWQQKGLSITGQFGDQLGASVCMPDQNTLAVGAQLNNEGGNNAGQVRVFRWDGADWQLKGNKINGEGDNNWFGSSVWMPDTNTIAIGAPRNNSNGIEAGHVRIYKWSGFAWIENNNKNPFRAYPNPTNRLVTVDLGSNYNSINVIVRNELGQDIQRNNFTNSSQLNFNIKGGPGLYFLEIAADNQRNFIKIIKE